MTCEQVRQDVAMALLGKAELDAATREHVANCPPCAAEQASLRSVVGLLPSIGRSDIESETLHVRADDQLLDRLLSRVASERRRSRRMRLTAGSGLALAASALAIALASVSGVFTPTEHSVVATAAAHGITATANIEPASSGSSLTIEISGVARNTTCRMQVIGTDGTIQNIVTWVADYSGLATTHGTSTFAPSQIRQVTVREVGGPVLLAIPVSA